MGLSEEYARPEWMITTILPVPPPQVRPSIQMDGSSRGEDDLTHKLSDVLKANANVRRCESEGAPVHVVQEFEQLLQVRRSGDITRPIQRYQLTVPSTLSSTLQHIWIMTLRANRKPCRNPVDL
jgi:DNA-directed RNA polymerase beta' subunit